jgi:predicted nucleotidyltransferase
VEDLEAFGRLITALRPWLAQVVVVGGWAHRLLRFHPLANAAAHLPLRTRDADVAIPLEATLAGDIQGALRRAGFVEELFGDLVPPATQYRLGKEDAGFFAEFLTPLEGSGLKRRGVPDATVARAGVTAQKVRYLELLLVHPWTVRLGQAQGVPGATDLEVPVPNPASFIVQKLLIHSHRHPAKRAQDILYIHDTLELFGGSLDELRRLWREVVRPTMPARTAKRAETLARDLFGRVTDTIREAARIPQDRQMTPENVRRACDFGLSEILGARQLSADQ